MRPSRRSNVRAILRSLTCSSNSARQPQLSKKKDFTPYYLFLQNLHLLKTVLNLCIMIKIIHVNVLQHSSRKGKKNLPWTTLYLMRIDVFYWNIVKISIQSKWFLLTFWRKKLAAINLINNVLRLSFVRGKCLTENKIRLFYTIYC